MTLMHFTFYACASRPDGTLPIKMYIAMSEPTRTDSPGDERRAVNDVRRLFQDMMARSAKRAPDEASLLQDGDAPGEALPVYTFAIGVGWDAAAKAAVYKQIDYRTLTDGRLFSSVYQLGAKLNGYAFEVLKNHERDRRERLGLGRYKWDRFTLERGREAFEEFCQARVRIHKVYLVNKKRFECPALRNGFCCPINPKCICYHNGKCQEVKP